MSKTKRKDWTEERKSKINKKLVEKKSKMKNFKEFIEDEENELFDFKVKGLK